MGKKYAGLPFDDAIEYLRKKVNIPTERWDDLWKEQHNKAFMVAGAADADLLEDLRKSVDRTINDGISLGSFKKDFDRIVAQHGWTGWKGEGSEKLRAWRIKLIYDQNMLSANAAGRERQMADPELQKKKPFKVYKIGFAVKHRPEHEALNNVALPATDPFWDTASPPNGFGCHCYTVLQDRNEMKRNGVTLLKDAPDFAPDPGFDYRPGSDEVQRYYDELRKKEAEMEKGLWARLSRYLDSIMKRFRGG